VEEIRAQRILRRIFHVFTRAFDMTERDAYSGMAALTICESLLLALNDGKILPESDILGVLIDAAVTHESAAGTETEDAAHKAVATLIREIISGGNSVRRP
jgi:hypothetical protein